MNGMDQNQFLNQPQEPSSQEPIQPQQLEIKSEIEVREEKKDKKYLKISLIVGVPLVIIALVLGFMFVSKRKSQETEVPPTITSTVPIEAPSFPQPQVDENQVILNELEATTNELNQTNLPNIDDELQPLDQDINQL